MSTMSAQDLARCSSTIYPLVRCDGTNCVVLNRPSPFSSLPAEIMHLIFDFGSRLRPSRKGELPFTLTVSQVDHRWRMIAFDTASLWTRIVITPKMPLHYITLYLRRSKWHRLDIQFNFKHLKSREARLASPILSCMKPYSPYWSHLSIISSSRMVIKLAIKMLDNLPLPHLQSLYISEIGDPECTRNLAIPSLPASVTTLRVDGFRFDFNALPLSGITSLHLEDHRFYNPAASLDPNIFREMPQLESLILMGSVIDMEDLAHESRAGIGLPLLHFLRISDANIAFMFMVVVSAPSIESLVLSNIPEALIVERAAHFPPFSHIDSLTITDTFLDIDSYAVMFHCFFRNLNHLAVLDSDVEPIFNLLSTAATPLLPYLYTLTLSSLPIPLLRPLIVDRHVRGRRLHALNLTSSLISELHADGLLRWLEGWSVDVTVFDEDALVNVPWTPT